MMVLEDHIEIGDPLIGEALLTEWETPWLRRIP